MRIPDALAGEISDIHKSVCAIATPKAAPRGGGPPFGKVCPEGTCSSDLVTAGDLAAISPTHTLDTHIDTTGYQDTTVNQSAGMGS